LIVGTVTIDLSLPGVNSLKEKRRRLKSLLARIRNKYNVSIAETACNDNHRTAQIGVAIACNSSAFADQVISKVVRMIDTEPEIVMTDYRVEIL
jgi:uncharacterized protein